VVVFVVFVVVAAVEVVVVVAVAVEVVASLRRKRGRTEAGLFGGVGGKAVVLESIL
jgi:hypothetical protein